MYQHFIQQAYIGQWKTGAELHIFDKESRTWATKLTASRLFGEEDWQSLELETAYAEAEGAIHDFVENVGEITDERLARCFVTWLALHSVRNLRNRDALKQEDYRHEVARVKSYFESRCGQWLNFPADVLITADNPVVFLDFGGTAVEVAPLSPRRAIILCPTFGDPVMSDGQLPFLAFKINTYLLRAATRHCVSADRDLHLIAPTGERLASAAEMPP
jgi:hypothetical protein